MSAAAVSLSKASLVLRHPDADQVAGNVVAPGQAVECLALQILLDDLALELDEWLRCRAMGFLLKARSR